MHCLFVLNKDRRLIRNINHTTVPSVALKPFRLRASISWVWNKVFRFVANFYCRFEFLILNEIILILFIFTLFFQHLITQAYKHANFSFFFNFVMKHWPNKKVFHLQLVSSHMSHHVIFQPPNEQLILFIRLFHSALQSEHTFSYKSCLDSMWNMMWNKCHAIKPIAGFFLEYRAIIYQDYVTKHYVKMLSMTNTHMK